MKTLASLTALLTLTAAPTRGDQGKANKAAIPAKADPNALTEAGYTALFDGKTLRGWRKVGGTGQFKPENGAIVGFGRNIRGNTFLRTEKSYADFVFIYEFQFVDPAGNSGCQFRSRQRNGNGRVYGYQCEHDNNRNRSYTGGVYEESDRGWLFPGIYSKDRPVRNFSAHGQELFRWDDWNTIVIRCEGNRIQTWLNGVARADFEDTDDSHFSPQGFIALQVHGGKSAHVRWRRLYIKIL